MAHSEIWAFTGREPCRWRVPFRVLISGNAEGLNAEILPAVPLLKRHERIVSAAIEKIARPSGANSFLLEENELPQLGEKIIGGEKLSEDQLEALFYWERERSDEAERYFKKDAVAGIEEMVDAAYAMGLGDCREQVHYWYSQLVRLMRERLLNHHLPVDLGFVRLHSSPYRVNWKSVLMSRFPTIGRALTHNNPKLRYEVAERALFADEMLSLDLLMMSKQGYCYRTIEAEMTPNWWKLVGRAEMERRDKLGEQDYAKYVTRSMRGALKANVAAYTRYCAEVARPSAAHVEGQWFGVYQLLPHRPGYGLHSKVAGVWPLPVVVDNKIPEFTPATDMEHLRATHEKMPVVPDLQSKFRDVRHLELAKIRRRFHKKKR